MDPLSITASLITLISAAEASNRGLQRLWSLRDAEANLEEVMNELTDFRALLQDSRRCLEALQDAKAGLPLDNVGTVIQRGSDVVQDLNDLIERKLSKKNSNDGTRKVRLQGWLKQSKLDGIRVKLADTRHSLIAALTTINTLQLCHVPRLLLSIQSITLAFPASRGLVCDAQEQPTKSQPIDQALQEIVATSSDVRLDLSRRDSGTLVIAVSTIEGRCDAYCCCQCHLKISVRTPQWLNTVVGNLFYRYSGSSILTKEPCNFGHCRRPEGGSLRLEYRFPIWMLCPVLSLSATWNALHGIGGSWSFRLPEYVQESTIHRMIRSGKGASEVEQFMDTNKISPRAMDSQWGEPLVYYAVAERNIDVCQMLISKGSDWFTQRPHGMSLAHHAWSVVFSSHKDSPSGNALRRLLELSDTLDEMNFNTLHKICVGLSSADLQEQIRCTPELVNGIDAVGMTPLMWTVKRDNYIATKTLLNWGADVHVKDRIGATALHFASGVPCAKALIHAQAGVNCTDIDGKTPLYKAAASGRSELIVLLLQEGADPNIACSYPVLAQAVEHEGTEAVSALLRYGADIDQCALDGSTAIIFAAEYNRSECLKLLCEEGARLNVITKAGYDILGYTATYASIEIMKTLTDAQITGLDMSRKKLDEYWELFNVDRDVHYVGTRAPGEEERAAFKELLASVRPLAEDLCSEDCFKLLLNNLWCDGNSEEFSDALESLDDDSASSGSFLV